MSSKKLQFRDMSSFHVVFLSREGSGGSAVRFEVESVEGGCAMFRGAGSRDAEAPGAADLASFTVWLNVSVENHVSEVDEPAFHGVPLFGVSAVDGDESQLEELPCENSGFDERRDSSLCPSPSLVSDTAAAASHSFGPQPTVEDSQWQLGVTANFSQFAQQPEQLLFPWETGVFAQIFGSAELLSLPSARLPEPDSGLTDRVIAAVDAVETSEPGPLDSCYDKAVRNVQDLEYFENKHRLLELACGQWLELLSCNWSATGVGEILASDMQKDVTGSNAFETLKACFGIKSPQTLLKRASSLKRYFRWHSELRADAAELELSPLPFVEQDVWSFFHWLRNNRRETNRGFTNASAFLETVRFMKFTLELRDPDVVLLSRRLPLSNLFICSGCMKCCNLQHA